MNPVERLLKINNLASNLKKNNLANSNDDAIKLATQIVDGKKSIEEVKRHSETEITGGHPVHKEDEIKAKVDRIIDEVDDETKPSQSIEILRDMVDDTQEPPESKVQEIKEKVEHIKKEIQEEIKHPEEEEIKYIKEEVEEVKEEIEEVIHSKEGSNGPLEEQEIEERQEHSKKDHDGLTYEEDNDGSILSEETQFLDVKPDMKDEINESDSDNTSGFEIKSPEIVPDSISEESIMVEQPTQDEPESEIVDIQEPSNPLQNPQTELSEVPLESTDNSMIPESFPQEDELPIEKQPMETEFTDSSDEEKKDEFQSSRIEPGIPNESENEDTTIKSDMNDQKDQIDDKPVEGSPLEFQKDVNKVQTAEPTLDIEKIQQQPITAPSEEEALSKYEQTLSQEKDTKEDTGNDSLVPPPPKPDIQENLDIPKPEEKKGFFDKIKEKFIPKEKEGKLRDLIDEADEEKKTVIDINK